MKKSKLLSFIALMSLLVDSVSGQNLDSLFAVYQDKSATDSVRSYACLEFAEAIMYTHLDSSMQLVEEQLRTLASSSLQSLKVKALFIEGALYREKGEYAAAQTSIKNALVILQGGNFPQLSAMAYTQLGGLKQDLVQYDSSFFFFDKALSIYESENDKRNYATVLSKKSYSAKNKADYPEAMRFAIEALKVFENLNDSSGMAATYDDISDVLYYQENYIESIEYAKLAMVILRNINNRAELAISYQTISSSFLILEEYDSALVYIDEAIQIQIAEKVPILQVASSLNTRGNIYKWKGDYDKAIADYKESLAIVEELEFEVGIMSIIANIGHVYVLKENYKDALPYTMRAIEMMEAAENKLNIVENYGHASTIYEGLGDYKAALEYYQMYSSTKDSIFSEERDERLSTLRTLYETEKKEKQIHALEHEAELMAANEYRDRQIRILLSIVIALFVVLAIGLWSRLRFTRKSRAQIKKEKERSDSLLLNILPEEIAQELKDTGKADARDFEMVSILFTDFKGFTEASAKMSAAHLVDEINHCFKAFDEIIGKYSIEKIKTIGDAYMAAGGLPVPNSDSVKTTVLAALEMQTFIAKRKALNTNESQPAFEMRVGIHTGPVVAGIVGVKKFQYDIWGDTVNTASRMESAGEVGKVNISQATYELLKDLPDGQAGDSQFAFEHRGKIEAKGKGQMDMYFVSLS